MKRVLSLFAFLFLASALFVVPVLGAELAGGYYITGNSAMGNGLTFYVPADYAAGSLTYDSSGNLFNLTASSIYLYCPDYPDYTIYANRFSGFQYRAGTGAGYQYQDLNLRGITSTNVEILEDSPSLALSLDKLLVMILVVLVIFVGAFVILRR